jgi:hypothetical protein
MMDNLILFAIVLLEHLLYDFHWQGNFIAENKGKHIFILFVHCLTWSLLIWLTGYFIAGWNLWLLTFMFITHFMSDYWKSHQPKTEELFYQIYVDQFIHLLSIIFVVICGSL